MHSSAVTFRSFPHTQSPRRCGSHLSTTVAALFAFGWIVCCGGQQLFADELGDDVLVDDVLYSAKPLTPIGSFTDGIEGPGCDADGNIFVVNYEAQQTIGKVQPSGQAEVFVRLPGESTGNGIVFDPAGQMYVADYVAHNVLKINPLTKAITVYAHNPQMNQPNDVALAADGRLYLSDPNWKDSTGQLWRVDRDGSTHRIASGMGTTNGIDLSPDGKTLYVNESVQHNVWAFRIEPDGSLTDKRLLHQFPDHSMDGMRVDVSGNLYITRYGTGTVVIMSPAGEILRAVDVLGPRPSNLCFGGPDGRTVYVTEVEHRRLVAFRVSEPGLAWVRNVQQRRAAAGAK